MVQLKTEIWQVKNGQFSLETKFRAAERGEVPVHIGGTLKNVGASEHEMRYNPL